MEVPTEFVWKSSWGGNNVTLTADFLGWKKFLPLHRDEKRNGDFVAITPLSPGQYKYKFVVDGVWKVAGEQRTFKEPNGVTNNFVEVLKPPPNTKGAGDQFKSKVSPEISLESVGPALTPKSSHHNLASLEKSLGSMLQSISPRGSHANLLNLFTPASRKSSQQNLATLSEAHTTTHFDAGLSHTQSPHTPQAGQLGRPPRSRVSSMEFERRDVAGRPKDKKQSVQDSVPGHVTANFVWKEGGNHVALTGDWLGWKVFLPMTKIKTDQGDVHMVSVPLKPGRYAYKFVTDATWRVAKDQPQDKDSGGNANNVIEIGAFTIVPPRATSYPGHAVVAGHVPKAVPLAHLRDPNAQRRPDMRPAISTGPKAPNASQYCFENFGQWRHFPPDYDPPTWEAFLGAVPCGDGTLFRVWGPNVGYMEVNVEKRGQGRSGVVVQQLRKSSCGQFFEGWIGGVQVGDVYRYGFYPNTRDWYPDPASRFQPDGVNGPSQIVNPNTFHWSDFGWLGVSLPSVSCIYEMHFGTFTKAGTFIAAIEKLRELKHLGVDCVELMPVADFAGNRNWGYDGTYLFAPPRCYGSPDDLRSFVNECHRLGIAVIVDCVYNHFGPDGNYLGTFASHSTRKLELAWGAANDLGTDLRWFMVENALFWVHEYHMDGIRLDSSHSLFDDRPVAFLYDLVIYLRRSLRQHHRQVMVICEDVRNWPIIYQPLNEGGYGCDATWSDDFHYRMQEVFEKENPDWSAADSRETKARMLAETIRRGWTAPHFGQSCSPYNLPSMSSFVYYIDNHDQVGNRPLGDRLHQRMDPSKYRAASVLLLSLPQTTLLFQGQEWGATSPFLFFSDHNSFIGPLVTEGRRKEFQNHEGWKDPRAREKIPDPQAYDTFNKSKLNWAERASDPHLPLLKLYRVMLRLRKVEPAFQNRQRFSFQIECIDNRCLVILRKPKLAWDSAYLILVQLKHGDHSVDLTTHPIMDPKWDGECHWRPADAWKPSISISAILPFLSHNVNRTDAGSHSPEQAFGIARYAAQPHGQSSGQFPHLDGPFDLEEALSGTMTPQNSSGSRTPSSIGKFMRSLSGRLFGSSADLDHREQAQAATPRSIQTPPEAAPSSSRRPSVHMYGPPLTEYETQHFPAPNPVPSPSAAQPRPSPDIDWDSVFVLADKTWSVVLTSEDAAFLPKKSRGHLPSLVRAGPAPLVSFSGPAAVVLRSKFSEPQ